MKCFRSLISLNIVLNGNLTTEVPFKGNSDTDRLLWIADQVNVLIISRIRARLSPISSCPRSRSDDGDGSDRIRWSEHATMIVDNYKWVLVRPTLSSTGDVCNETVRSPYRPYFVPISTAFTNVGRNFDFLPPNRFSILSTVRNQIWKWRKQKRRESDRKRTAILLLLDIISATLTKKNNK